MKLINVHKPAALTEREAELLEALEEAKKVICSLKLSMAVHPDNEEGSEFEDYTGLAQETEDMIEKIIKKAKGL